MRLKVPRLKFTTYLTTLLILIVVRVVVHNAGPLVGESEWIAAVLNIVSTLVTTAIGFLMLWALYAGLARAAAWVIPNLLGTEDIKLDQPEEVKAVDNRLGRLNTALSKLTEADIDQAAAHIRDATAEAVQVFRLAQGVAKKAQNLAQRETVLGEALAAIANRDRLKMAEIGGRLAWDQILQSAMLSEVAWENEVYWSASAKMLAKQKGELAYWQVGCSDYAAALIERVSDSKSRVTALMIASDFIWASRALTEIDASLAGATDALCLHSPGLRWSLNAHVPEMAGSLEAGR